MIARDCLILQITIVTGIVIHETTHYNLTLEERLEIEKTTVHWLPYKRILFNELQGGEIVEICWQERPRAIEEFPDGWWTRKSLAWLLSRRPTRSGFITHDNIYSCLRLGEERLKGRFVIHIFVAVYLFIALAFICDKYFLPTVEVICQKLNLTQVSFIYF